MNLIAAVDKNWAIGLNGKLLVRIPEDMKFFQRATTGKVAVMGRKTLESFPGGQPLKNRTNIVLTANRNFQVKGAQTVHSMEELLEELKQYRSEDIYIIGGESVYRQMVDLCDVAHIPNRNTSVPRCPPPTPIPLSHPDLETRRPPGIHNQFL